MPDPLPKFADQPTATQLFHNLGQDFAVVKNLAHVYPPYDLYPLAPAKQCVAQRLKAAVMDMDGTTTTTEPLCIDALETMVRRISGRMGDANWAGLNPDQDYPHIIGNSSTRHVEYLLQTYRDTIQPKAFMEALIQSAAWTLGHSPDESRRQDLVSMLSILGLSDMMADHRFKRLQEVQRHDGPDESAVIATLAESILDLFPGDDFPHLTRASVEIYYQRYHALLAAVAEANGAVLPAYLNAPAEGLLIEPMPGIGIYLALVAGLLGEEAPTVVPTLYTHLHAAGLASELSEGDAVEELTRLGVTFQTMPARVALVTSSIAYEAEVVLGEVFRQLHAHVDDWGLSPTRTEALRHRFASPKCYYDAIITASDSCEMRLKPHRDLYSLALGRLGLHPDEFGDVVGFEDSESGTIAIRAAGIPVCCALPFHMTTGHLYQAASHTCVGGLPEVMLLKGCFLPR